MNKLELLQSRLNEIDAAIAALKDQGDVIEGARLELFAPGGTAGGKSRATAKYGRLRWGRGAERGSRYIPLDQLAATEAAIDRGCQAKALRKEGAAIAKQLAKLQAAIAA